jgi:hypothetical protein
MGELVEMNFAASGEVHPMACGAAHSNLKAMKKMCLALGAFLLASTAQAQWYNVTLRAVSYGRDASGNLAATPLTEHSIIEAAAEAKGISTNNLALIYHVESGGDSIKVVDRTTAAQHMKFFLFTFGQSLGRTGVTNSAGTEIRVLEYAYTDGSRYSSWNDHSMGSVILTKRILTDSNGTVRHAIDGQNLQWCVLPQGSRSAQTCVGSFQTGTPFVVGQ